MAGRNNASAAKWSCCHHVAGDKGCRQCSTYSNLDPCIHDDDGQVRDVRQIICAGSSDDVFPIAIQP